MEEGQKSTTSHTQFTLETTVPICESFKVFSNSQFVIACLNPKESQSSELMFEFIKTSMIAFFKEFLPTCEESSLHCEEFHFERMCNLLLSCREQINFMEFKTLNQSKEPVLNKNACNFALCYRIKDKIYCLKTPGLEVYQINEQNYNLKPISNSTKIAYSKMKITKGIKGFINSKMPNIKSQFMAVRQETMKSLVNSSKYEAIFDSITVNKNETLQIVIGSSSTFAFISPCSIPKFMKSHDKDKDKDKEKSKNKRIGFKQKIQLLLEETSKKMQTIYKQELYLLSWKA